ADSPRGIPAAARRPRHPRAAQAHLGGAVFGSARCGRRRLLLWQGRRPPTLGVAGYGHRITVDDGLLAGVLTARLQPDDGTVHLMDVFRLHGPSRLTGAVDVRGAKNSVLKLMAASLLAVGRTTITNVPAILDVRIMVELLVRLGCEVDYDS